MDRFKKYKQFRLHAVILLLDALFFAFFSPDDSAWVILPALVLMIMTIWLLFRLLVQGLSRIVPLKAGVQKRLVRLFVVATGLVIALQSIGQLTAKDVLTIVPLVAILYFYLAYAGSASAGR